MEEVLYRLLVLSVATEAVVEIAKPWVSWVYSKATFIQPQYVYYVLSIIGGGVAVLVTQENVFSAIYPNYVGYILTATCTALGSRFWHDVLAIVRAIKETTQRR